MRVITEIHMDAVASFKHAASLSTDKKINLVYGLNGTGKSTISNFLYAPTESCFAQCRKSPEQAAPILVYNQRFIQDNFFVADGLKGIFSLSKENKAAEEKIAVATKRLEELNQSLERERAAKEQVNQEFATQKQQAIEEAWKIKTKYSGGDRVLEYCLDGLKGQKEKLFSHLHGVTKQKTEPEKTIEMLRSEVDALTGNAAQQQPALPLLAFSASDVELEPIFQVSILGNTDSEVATLIDSLGNSDWVKQGLGFLPKALEGSKASCPFCQEKTITSKFLSSITEYFDENYQKQLDALASLRDRYISAQAELQIVETFVDHPFAKDHSKSLAIKHQAIIDTLRGNVLTIEQKIKNPKALQAPVSTAAAVAEFNGEVSTINSVISAYNQRLINRNAALASLRDEFWFVMRWQYDQTMVRFEADLLATNLKLKALDGKISKIDAGIADAKKQIVSAQKETVNIDVAVEAINAGLLDLGIDDFKIAKHSENLYRVVRIGDSADAFHTLSEGEKMVISFLYFCELCEGKVNSEDTHAQRIVVLDDPISSLSHIFVFNVGQLIRSVFFKGERCSQIFVLTHSLYFFYELTDPNHDRRKQNQRLFRITKSSSGSSIQEMKYEEIQNDYQAYWSVVNDSAQPPALIANCMRNIVEYFFNFVRKKDLNNVFLMPELQDVKFQAFCRYVNRESHSLGQNIIDMKEFQYEIFKEGLKLVFVRTGYADHFAEMSKV
jgi:wobble nucleotide-excising tRNase